MKKNIAVLDSVKVSSDYRRVANDFEEIAEHEKKDWLSYYYSGVCNVLVAFDKKGKEIDVWCDKAELLSKKADSLSANNSEVKVLKSMIAAARIKVNQAQRGQRYGAQANKFVNEALKLNDKNPRAYLQKATVVMYTPEVLGGGVKKAKPHFETAIDKFNSYKKENAIAPNWGKERAEKLLKECTKKITAK